jgi:hypothetical protein
MSHVSTDQHALDIMLYMERVISYVNEHSYSKSLRKKNPKMIMARKWRVPMLVLFMSLFLPAPTVKTFAHG